MSSSSHNAERRRVTSVQQLEKLVKLMENQIELALCIGRSKEDRADSAKVWQKHAATLNAVPGANRSAREWCRAWNDLKCRVNVKLRKNRALRAKGAEPLEFSSIELRVARIMTQSLTKKPKKAGREPGLEMKKSVAADLLDDSGRRELRKPKIECKDPLSRQELTENSIELGLGYIDDQSSATPQKRTIKLINNLHKLNKELFNPNQDEFQFFASNIAAQLRELPLDRALKLQIEVQNLVAKERLKFFEDLKTEAEMFFVMNGEEGVDALSSI